MKKIEILNSIEEMEKIIDNFEIKGELSKKIKDIKKDIANFTYRIPVVGRFSAGKSALLNTLLEREILKESQAPETAIATELVYGESEKAILVNTNGKEIECSLNEANKENPEYYSHYIYHINNQFLQEHQDIVLVDMPGFDSGLERHSKAIFQYVDKASAYILAVDVCDGALSQPTINFLREINKYGSDVVIVLTKCDIKDKNEVETIANHIEKTVTNVYGKPIPIITTDIMDSMLPIKLNGLLQNIDLEKSFVNRYTQIVKEIKTELLDVLKTIKDSLYYNSYELDKRVRDLEKANESMQRQLESQRFKLHNKLFNNVLNEVATEVQVSLEGSINRLVNSAMVSEEAFANAINDIIRPIIIVSLHKKIDLCLANFVNEIDFKSDGLLDIESVSNNIRKIYEGVSNSLNKYRKIKPVNTNISGTGTAQGILTVLALATDIVAPEIEVLLIFLPQLLPMIDGWFKKYQMDSLKNKMREEIIPEIMISFRNNLKVVLDKIEAEEFEEIKTHINELIELKQEAIKNLQQESEEGKAALKEKMDALDSVIAKLM